MFERLRRLIAPPNFDSEEKTSTAKILNDFGWSAITVLLSIFILRLNNWEEASLSSRLIYPILALIVGVALYLNRRGYVRGSAMFSVAFLWLALTMQAGAAEGIRDAAIITHLALILLAGLVLGWREGLFLGGMSIVVIWMLAFREDRGTMDLNLDEPLDYARDLTVVFTMTTLLVYFLIRNLNRSLGRAHMELEERLHAQEVLVTQAKYLTTIHETALGLVNRLELNPLLESILNRAGELLDTPHVAIDLVLEDQSALRQELGHGILEESNGELTKKGFGLVGKVWERGRVIYTQDYNQWEGHNPKAEYVGFESVMGVPLKSGEKVTGVLTVSRIGDDNAFTDEQVVLMERLAALASIAIDNARLHEQAQTEIRERRLVEQALRASDERFRKIFHASPVAICLTALEDGELLDANDAYWKLSGYDPEASLGRNAEELQSWNTMDERIKFAENLKTRHSLHNPNYQFFDTAGNIHHVLAFYELIDVDYRQCVLSMFYDVTEQTLAQDALANAEARTRAILESIPDMIFEISKNGMFLDFVDSTEIKPVIPPSEFLGSNIKELFPEDIASQTMNALRMVFVTGELQTFEYNLPRDEMENTYFEARISAITSESAVIMVRDISQRRWVETEREKLISELEQKNSELERFAYTVSHDLKSPLITIKGFLGFLEKDASAGNAARLKSDIQRIADATDKMHHLLSDLLELSRIGRMVNPYQSIPFNEIIQEALSLVWGNLHENSIKVDVQEGMPVIHGDRQRLVEVVQNLADNAAKFAQSGPNPLIEIGQSGMDGKMPIFFVRDNGIGIKPEHHERIFGLFNKLDVDSEGTGVGLAIVKRIIEVHGGRIWVESEAGMGATFFFTLPAPE